MFSTIPENTCAGVSFLIKLRHAGFIKNEIPVQVFPCEFWENTYSAEHFQTLTSVKIYITFDKQHSNISLKRTAEKKFSLIWIIYSLKKTIHLPSLFFTFHIQWLTPLLPYLNMVQPSKNPEVFISIAKKSKHLQKATTKVCNFNNTWLHHRFFTVNYEKFS